ncbi:LuxR family two component transcriptional regulator [Haloactinopolyspora alba]|uniref:LuxR family two component transcriptional regulator n=1 Tax=Haloactinopolyspora alba TaxID=648780 RepID=A0A2P8DJ09_9ACTN|nr:response regulator transcription factor [Haloactinopolyspora alba]PSK97216.1 LuxR family two component transcriptional regulator [Haloactinopolyspora alba]
MSEENPGVPDSGAGDDGPAGGVIRVVVVDDQTLVRMGLRTLLEAEDDTELAAEAADGRDGMDAVRRTVPDIVLMDIRMPVLDGLSALREITAEPALSDVKVIMLTTFELDEYVFESLRGGASGFVLKDSPPEELLHAVRVVAAGESLLSPSVTRRVIEQFSSREAVPSPTAHPELSRLTDREREIVAWVATGRSNDEIAAELVVSPATVRTHVSRAMVKLHARDRAQLVVFAVQSGLTLPG